MTRFAFPVVIDKTARDIVVVVLMGDEPVYGDNIGFCPNVLDGFGFRPLTGVARHHFRVPAETPMTSYRLTRHGHVLHENDAKTVRGQNTFNGHSAQLALLLQLVLSRYEVRAGWKSFELVWATGTVTEENGEDVRLGTVEPGTFECKLNAFLADDEPARLFLCPAENLRGTGYSLRNIVPWADFSRRTKEDGSNEKLIVTCQPYELVDFLTQVFPELAGKRNWWKEFRQPLRQRFAFASVVFVIGGVVAQSLTSTARDREGNSTYPRVAAQLTTTSNSDRPDVAGNLGSGRSSESSAQGSATLRMPNSTGLTSDRTATSEPWMQVTERQPPQAGQSIRRRLKVAAVASSATVHIGPEIDCSASSVIAAFATDRQECLDRRRARDETELQKRQPQNERKP